MTGFSNDWAYMHLGIHSLLPEIAAAGRDYDGDGYVTQYEIMRWNDEEKGGKYFAPWTPHKHPELGDVEIGGMRGMPQGIDDRLKEESEVHFALLMHAAELAPDLKVIDVRHAQQPDGSYKVTATLQNRGFLSTYVTRQALAVRRDEPIMARITVEGARVKGHAVQRVGHILGRLAYIRRWGAGADESTRTVEWSIEPTGSGPISVSVEAWAHKAGRDRGTTEVSPSQQ